MPGLTFLKAGPGRGDRPRVCADDSAVPLPPAVILFEVPDMMSCHTPNVLRRRSVGKSIAGADSFKGSLRVGTTARESVLYEHISSRVRRGDALEWHISYLVPLHAAAPPAYSTAPQPCTRKTKPTMTSNSQRDTKDDVEDGPPAYSVGSSADFRHSLQTVTCMIEPGSSCPFTDDGLRDIWPGITHSESR
jgi:hypothetical protein